MLQDPIMTFLFALSLSEFCRKYINELSVSLLKLPNMLMKMTYLFTLIYSLIVFYIRKGLFPLYSTGCSISDNYPLWSIFIPPLAVLCSVTDDPRCLEHFWGNLMNKKCKLLYLTDCVLGDVAITVIIDMHFSDIM